MVDSHCHLADEAFRGDLEAVVARARAAGLREVLCILSADDPEELTRAAGVKDAWPEVRFAAGVHPHRAGSYAGRVEQAAERLRDALTAVSAVAVGEIGLDYHYDFAPRDVQQEVFAAQLAVAASLDRPVVIHAREAAADTAALIREVGGGRLRGVMHCFSGTREEARAALELGLMVSFAGMLTFAKADLVRDVARYVPADRVLVETDAPFLAPVPHRGKRNEPAWVMETLRRLAIEKNLPLEEASERVAATFTGLLGGGAMPTATQSSRRN